MNCRTAVAMVGRCATRSGGKDTAARAARDAIERLGARMATTLARTARRVEYYATGASTADESDWANRLQRRAKSRERPLPRGERPLPRGERRLPRGAPLLHRGERPLS